MTHYAIRKIMGRYDANNDMRPDGPPVTWAEFELAQAVQDLMLENTELRTRINVLENRMGVGR